MSKGHTHEGGGGEENARLIFVQRTGSVLSGKFPLFKLELFYWRLLHSLSITFSPLLSNNVCHYWLAQKIKKCQSIPQQEAMNKQKNFFANYFSKLTQSLICLWYLKNIHTQEHSDQTFLIPSTSKIQILLVNNVLCTEKLVYFLFIFGSWRMW